jgi:hypothetical protein
MNKKIIISLLSLFIVSFSLYLVNYNFIEKVKLSINSEVELDTIVEFSHFDIISTVEFETDKESGWSTTNANYIYVVNSTRSQISKFDFYNDVMTVKVLPNYKHSDLYTNYGETPNPKSNDNGGTLFDRDLQAGAANSSSSSDYHKETLYQSTYLLIFSISTLFVLSLYLFLIKFNVFNPESYQGKFKLSDIPYLIFEKISVFLLNLKHHILNYLKSIIYVPILLLLFILFGNVKDFITLSFISEINLFFIFIFLVIVPILSYLNYFRIYKKDIQTGLVSFLYYFYHTIFSIIILFFIAGFYIELQYFFSHYYFDFDIIKETGFQNSDRDNMPKVNW